MNKFITTILAVSMLTACGGRTPAPVMVAQYGDDRKSCKALEYEMTNTQAEINRILPKTDKTGKNVALGVAGVFLLVPWFFMDFKEAEQTEYEALRQRYNHLAMIAVDKNCGLRQERYPSVSEMEREYKKSQAQPAHKTATPN